MKRGYFTNIIVPIPEGAHICGDQRVYLDRTKKYYLNFFGFVPAK